MSPRDPEVCHTHQRIAWAQAYGARKVFSGQLQLAENDLYPAAHPPRQCQVRIDRERPIDERGAGAEVVDQIGERKPGPAQGDRVVVTNLGRTSSETLGFGDLLYAIYYPATLLTLPITLRGQAIGRGKLRV